MYIGARFMHEGPAVRDPISVGTAIFTALGAAELGGTAIIGSITLAQVVGYTAITAGSLALSYAANRLFAPSAPALGQSAQSGISNQITIRQGLVSRRRSYGRVKIAGAIAFEEVDGGAVQVAALGFGTRNLWIQQLQGQGEIDAVEEHWIADDQVLLDGSHKVTNGVFASHLWIKSQLGTADQVTQPSLLAAFTPDITDDHRWRGVPNTLLIFDSPDNAAQAQAQYGTGVPNYRAVQRGALLYDPREGTHVANGDPDDPTASNWEWSDNAALVILDFLRHPDGWRRPKDRAVVPIAKFRVADWIAFADVCDELVDRKGGNPEKRYRLAGTYDLTAPPKVILQGMLDACDAEPYRHKDGTIGVRGGSWVAPDVAIDDDVAPGIIEHSLQRGRGKNSACNIIHAKYTSARHDYQQVDMDPWLDQANIDLRGEELAIDLDLSWCPSHSQARRLAKIAMAKRNPQWAGTIVTGPHGLRAFNQRTISATIAELGIEDVSFLLASFQPSEGLDRVSLGISSFDAAAYEWDAATEEGDAPAINVVVLADSTVPVPTAITVVIAFDGGLGYTVATVTWTNTSGLTLFYEGQISDATGAISGASAVATADGSNTGSGVLTLDATHPFSTLVSNGVYRVVCFSVTPVTFHVFHPRGRILGTVVPGATFNNQVKFVISVPGTNPNLNDAFSITVSGVVEDWVDLDIADDSLTVKSGALNPLLDYIVQMRAITPAGKSSFWVNPA